MLKIVFLHPDLGIGGAERLVVDAALALKQCGHSVRFVTAHHDPSHCFTETRDGTLDVTAVGDWLPRSIGGKFYALCAYVRMIYIAYYLTLFSGLSYDVIFCDQISACIPILRLFSSAKVLFYCHFPDQLLTGRQTLLKRLYRAPLDWVEEKTTGMAHEILVNSNFTAQVFKETFTSLSQVPGILYPSVNFEYLDNPDVTPLDDGDLAKKNSIFLSINRYERKKDIGLAIKALDKLKSRLTVGEWKMVHLVVAGGYDERVIENVEHYLELRQLATELKVNDNITFLRSITDAQKRGLLKICCSLLYTPDREHFGIVPIEAMYAGRPVIAIASGGPKETVLHEETGFLCENTAESFANAMHSFVQDANLSKVMGERAVKHVQSSFSFDRFATRLESIVVSMAK